MENRLIQLSNKYKQHGVHFFRIDTKTHEALCREAGVSAIPEFHFFFNQEIIYKQSGGDCDHIQSIIDQFLEGSGAKKSFDLIWTTPTAKGTPPCFSSVKAVYFKEKIWVFPGREELHPDLSVLSFFDIKLMSWIQINPAGFCPNSGCSSISQINQFIFYFCGPHVQVFALDTENQTWIFLDSKGKKPLSCHDGRVGYSTIALGSFIYLFGGGCNERDDRFNDLYRFHIETKTWESIMALGMIPDARSDCTMDVELSGKLLVFGGEAAGRHGFQEFNEFISFDIESCKWESLQVKGINPTSRKSHSTSSVGAVLFIIGGEHNFKTIHPMDISAIDLKNMCWVRFTESGQRPKGRANHCSVRISENKLVIFGGLDEEGNILQDLHLLEIK